MTQQRLPRAPRADHMTFGKGRYRVPSGVTVEIYTPLKRGTGLVQASSNMMTCLPYDDDNALTRVIGISNKYVPAKAGTDLDLYDLRHFDREIAPIIKSDLLEMYNGGADTVQDGDTVAPHSDGFQKWSTGMAKLGTYHGWTCATSGRGYVQVNIDNSEVM